MVNIGDFRDANLSFYNNSAGHTEAQVKDVTVDRYGQPEDGSAVDYHVEDPRTSPAVLGLDE